MTATLYSKEGTVLAYLEPSPVTGMLTGVSIADGIAHVLEYQDKVHTIGEDEDGDFDILVGNVHVLKMNPVMIALEMPRLPRRSHD